MVEGDIFHFKNGNFRSEGFWEGGLVHCDLNQKVPSSNPQGALCQALSRGTQPLCKAPGC